MKRIEETRGFRWMERHSSILLDVWLAVIAVAAAFLFGTGCVALLSSI